MINNIEAQSKQEFAYNAIRDSIIIEEYAPNQMISTRALCAKLGISRTPVIEALKKLSYEGFVELIPNRGVTITSIKPSDLIEIYQLREGMEGIAARMCAVNHPKEIIEQMRICLEECDDAFKNGYYGKAIGFDDDFHRLLIEGSGNRLMMQTMNSAIHQCGRGNFLRGTAPTRMKKSAMQHRNILKAITKRDPALAEQCAREHMRDVQQFILGYEKAHKP